MALICNVIESEPQMSAEGGWGRLYRQNERFIESGSAYFSQAFADVLNLVSDIELHNLTRAQLRVASAATLLDHAIEQYRTSLELDDQSGLGAYHESTLRELGLDEAGTEKVLRHGRESGYVAADDEFVKGFAKQFHEHGYRALMDSYIGRLTEIRSLLTSGDADTGADMTDWQGFTWRLTSAFSSAMMFGQCIAVMNSAAYR